jgi:peptidoglycan/LPS O-acetylase OafA/YrhL
MVVATHVGFQTGATFHGAFGAVLARLDVGVALFFVLSGFLLVRPWLDDDPTRPVSVRVYSWRRAARILPAYWIALAVVLLTTARGTSGSGVLRNVALVQTYGGPLLPGYTQTWSLCTEVAFYAVLPVAAVPLVRAARSPAGAWRAATWLVVACVVAWVWAGLAAAGALPRLATTWLPGHLDWFAVGLLLALGESLGHRAPGGRLNRLRTDLGQHPWSLLTLAAALFWLAATPIAGPRGLTNSTPGSGAVKELLYAAIAALVVLAAGAADQRRGSLAGALGHPVVRWLGLVSYGIFLWHLLVLSAVLNVRHRQIFTGGFWTTFALTTAGSILIAWASWSLVERRVLRAAHQATASGEQRRPARRP